MSNFKIIDGIQVNLSLIVDIIPEHHDCSDNSIYVLKFCYIGDFKFGAFIYRTKKKAEARINEILKNQNSDKTEI